MPVGEMPAFEMRSPAFSNLGLTAGRSPLT